MIDILLATYNSEDYLREQLNSLFEQTEQCWKLLIQDDGSTDGTKKIIEIYQGMFPDKIVFYQNPKNLGGAKYNFYDLLLKSNADYVMTCDHDDVWKPDKIEKTLTAMHDLEEIAGKDRPLLIHTDLEVVDRDCNLLAESMFYQQNLDASRRSFSELLVQNNVTGCTVMVNKALIALLPATVPANMIMHDWWLALVASAFGEIGFVNEATIYYRQHGDNEVGAKNVRSFGYNAKRAAKFAKARQVLNETYLQAADFASVYRDRLTAGQLELANAYGSMGQYSKIKRLRTLRKYKLWKNGLTRRIGQFFFC